MTEIRNFQGEVTAKVGWTVKCVHSHLDALKHFKDKFVVVDEIQIGNKGNVIFRFKGEQGWHWSGFFMKVNTKFKPGDRVRFIGKNKDSHYASLAQRVLTVKVIHPELTDNVAQMISFHELKDFEYYNATNFETVEMPNFKEILLEACNLDMLNDYKSLYLDIKSGRAEQIGLQHTKQDLLQILRILERHHVRGRVLFDSDMKADLSLTIDADDIMEELSNNTPKTLPITALKELCNIFDVTAWIDRTKYLLGYNLDVYETEDVPMSTVQKA